MQRMGDRLVEVGLATQFFSDSKQGTGGFEWTPNGMAFRDALKKIFDVANVRPDKISGLDIIALVQVILSLEPI